MDYSVHRELCAIVIANIVVPDCDHNGNGMCTTTDFTAWSSNINDDCEQLLNCKQH
jgi:hypothetical protein